MPRSFERSSLWCARFARHVSECHIIGRDQTGARARLDRHVAQGHAPFHRKCGDGVTRIFDDVTGAACCADFCDDRQRNVFCSDANRQCARHGDAHVFRFGNQQSLRCQHMLDFRCADAECQRTKRAMGRGVRIPANHGDTRQRETLFGTNNVHDTLADIAHRQIFDAEFFCVGFECCDLNGRFRIGDASRAIGGGHIVIGHGQRHFGAAHFAARHAQTFKRLRARHLMHKVAVDIKHAGLARHLIDQMRIPDFVVQSLAHFTFQSLAKNKLCQCWVNQSTAIIMMTATNCATIRRRISLFDQVRETSPPAHNV